MKILLTGAAGQLGSCILDIIPTSFNILAMSSSELDITNADQINNVLSEFLPDYVINTAAFTAVDRAESESSLAKNVNSLGPLNLAKSCKMFGSKLIHISSDYVFDGSSSLPYSEDSVTNPISVYGKTKLEGEHSVLSESSDSIIIRTSWVFSEYGNNFIKTMISLGQKRDTIGIVSDQIGSPTYAGDLAELIIYMIMNNPPGGIYHFSGDKSTSWYDFAVMIFSEAIRLELLSKSPTLLPLTTEQYPTAAVRPKYSVMDNKKIIDIGFRPSNWKCALSVVLKKI